MFDKQPGFPESFLVIALEYGLLKNLFEFLFQPVFVGPEIMGKLSQGRKGFPQVSKDIIVHFLEQVHIRGAVWDSRYPEWGLKSIAIISAVNTTLFGVNRGVFMAVSGICGEISGVANTRDFLLFLIAGNGWENNLLYEFVRYLKNYCNRNEIIDGVQKSSLS